MNAKGKKIPILCLLNICVDRRRSAENQRNEAADRKAASVRRSTQIDADESGSSECLISRRRRKHRGGIKSPALKSVQSA